MTTTPAPPPTILLCKSLVVRHLFDVNSLGTRSLHISPLLHLRPKDYAFRDPVLSLQMDGHHNGLLQTVHLAIEHSRYSHEATPYRHCYWRILLLLL